MPELIIHNQNRIRALTLNRLERRNALSDSLLAALQSALDDADADPAVRVVVIAANGPVFCAGHDLQEMRQKSGLAEYRDVFDRCGKMMQTIVALSKPVIAQVQGTATAAGCQLVASCDLAVAADTAKFATPGVHIGLFCSTPMVALSRKVGAAAAMEMLLLGDAVSAAKAREIGLVNAVVPADNLADAVGDWAGKIAGKSAPVIAIGKKAFYQQATMPLARAYDYTGEVMAQNMTHPDAHEGISAFAEKRAPVWSG